MNALFTYILTLIIPLAGGGNLLLHSKLQDSAFFSKGYTDVIKGMCCLIVIYVHVKPERGNLLQDAIGSFAYVCVTFFFLVSAYGMLRGLDRKKDYWKYFWRNRLASLLIPCLCVNIVVYILSAFLNVKSDLALFYHIDEYVIILLQWCVWFYIVEWCRMKWFVEKKDTTLLILIIGVVVSSLYYYFFAFAKQDPDAGWCFERMGLVWGILLYRYYDRFVMWMDKSRILKIIVLTFIGGILGVFYLKYKMIYFWGAYLMKIVLGFALLLLLFTATSKLKFDDVISNWLGSISYEVYLIHRMILAFMALLLPLSLNSGAYVFIVVFVTLLLSTGIHAIDKPIVKSLRK